MSVVPLIPRRFEARREDSLEFRRVEKVEQIKQLANIVVERGASEEEPVHRVELFQIAPDKRRV